MTDSNLDRLRAYVQRVLVDAPRKPDPAAYVEANRNAIAKQLEILSGRLLRGDATPCPSHLVGLDEFDLIDARTALDFTLDNMADSKKAIAHA